MAHLAAAHPDVDATWPPRVRWWQSPWVRAAVGVLTFLALLSPPFVLDADQWELELPGPSSIRFGHEHFSALAALLLMPFLRRVSYRKRDILILVLVPLYGQYVAAKIVSRLLFLPLRDWPPRPDEVPRTVRVPRGRGIYLLRRSFAEAEQLRVHWCGNARHGHPYDSWSIAHHIGCTGAEPDQEVAAPGSGRATSTA